MNTWTIWVCTCCLSMAANGECCDSDQHGGDGDIPLSTIEPGQHVSPGIGWEDHSEDCLTHVVNKLREDHSKVEWPDVPGDYECDCETDTFSRSQCDGCGSYLHGERHGMTLFEPTGDPAPAPEITKVPARELRPGMRIANGTDSTPAPAPTDVKVTTRDGERITYAHIPNGDPERIEYFRNLAERSGAFTNITAEPSRKSTPAPVMHYGASRILCGAEPEYRGSDRCTGGDAPCPNACQCGCNTGEFECQCTNLTETLADVTCKPCKDGLHRPVDARSDAMVDRTASDDRTAPQDAVWDRESTERALSGGPEGAPELNTGHVPLYDFPVTVRKVQPTPAPNAPQAPAGRAVNGHVMEYRVTGVDENGRFTVSQWDAQHSDTCPCVMSGGDFY